MRTIEKENYKSADKHSLSSFCNLSRLKLSEVCWRFSLYCIKFMMKMTWKINKIKYFKFTLKEIKLLRLSRKWVMLANPTSVISFCLRKEEKGVFNKKRN